MAWVQLTVRKNFTALCVVLLRDLLRSSRPTASIMTSLITGALEVSGGELHSHELQVIHLMSQRYTALIVERY